MRILTKCFSKKAFYALLLVALVGAIAVTAFMGGFDNADNEGIVANAAISLSDTTLLSGGLGMQYGANALRTSDDDFYYDGTGSVEYNQSYSGSTAIKMSGKSTLITKPGIVVGTTSNYENLNPNASVFYALYDKDVTVRFNVEFSLKGSIASPFSVYVDMYYSNGAEASTVVESSRIATQEYSVNATDSYSNTVTLQTSVSGAQRVSSAAHLYVEIRFDSGANSLYLSNPLVTVSSESSQILVDGERGIQLEISGNNRNTVIIPDVLSEEGRAKLNSLYVKAGDIITLAARYAITVDGISDSNHSFTPTYSAAIGRNGKGSIDWYSYYNENYGQTATHLKRVEDEQLIVYPSGTNDPQYDYKIEVYNGFTASFVVQSTVTNAKSIQIIPRIVREYHGGNNYTYWSPSDPSAVSNSAISIKVDNKAPTAPKLDMSTGLGLSIKENKWFTQSSSVRLAYDENTVNSNASVAYESVYAFLVDPSFTTLPVGYDFTPGNGAEYNYTVSGTAYSSRRQELGLFSNTATNLQVTQLRFDIAGEYGLVLYAVDSAGNVSSPTLYTVNQGYTVKADWNTKGVGIHISYGNSPTVEPSTSNKNEFQKYCTAYVFAGDAFHDADGNCTQPIDDNPTANSTLTNLQLVKRGITVTIRIVMDATQAYNYSLVRLGSTFMQYDNPVYEIDRFGNRVYQYTYFLNDTIWEYNPSSAVRATTAYFHRRVDLMLLNDDFTFNYTWSANAVEFADKMEAYFADGSETVTVQPEIVVEYFKTVNYIVESAYVMNGSRVQLVGAGVLTVDKVDYDYDENFDATAFTRGEIPFISGASEFYVMDVDSVVTNASTGRATITMRGYDLSTGRMEGFKDAGDYYYYAYVKAGANTFYYGELIDGFTIKKADPEVKEAFATNFLTYGQSLGEVVFSSLDKGNLVIPQTNSITVAGQSYIQVSSGVYGAFVIRVPQPGSPDYETPNVAEAYTVTVEFQPIDLQSLTTAQITDNYAVLEAYFTPILATDSSILGYTLKEGMQCSTNYNVVTVEIPIEIRHKYATVLAVVDSLTTSYDGYEKQVSTYVYTDVNGQNVQLSGIPVIVEYKLKSEGDGSYTTARPTSAGQYDVRMRIDDAISNYESDVSFDTLFINQRELTVSVDESVKEYSVLKAEEVMEGHAVSDVLTYTYSYTSTAQYVSGYTDLDGVFNRVSGLTYKYTLLKYAYYDFDQNVILIDSPVWMEPVEIIGANALEAGVYLMDVSIENQNNAGTKYIKVDVKQVRRGDEATLTVSMPSAQANYQTVNLDGSSKGKSGHLEFGQTLESMVSTILGTGGSAKYTPKGALSAVSISSRFIFESESDYVTRTMEQQGFLELETNGYGESVFPVRYNEAGVIIPYSVMVIWQAGSVVDGVFVPNYNFRAEAFLLDLYVVRATPDFDDFRLSTLTYGQKVGEASFEGTISSYGYLFSADDFTVTVPDATKSYVPQGGQNDILCTFTPSDALIRKYLPINNVPIALTVEKRDTVISFDYQTVTPEDFDGSVYQDAVKYVYGSAFQNPHTALSAVENVSSDVVFSRDQEGNWMVNLRGTTESAVYLTSNGQNTTMLTGTLTASVGSSTLTFNFDARGFSLVDGTSKATYSGNYFYEVEGDTVTVKRVISLSTSGVNPQFTYYRDMIPGEIVDESLIFTYNGVQYVKINAVSSDTPVGKYYVLAEILDSEKNFSGNSFNAFFVVRGTLYYEGGSLPQMSIEYSENINSVDFGTVTLVNSQLGNYNKYFRGTLKVAVLGDDGEFVYDYLPEVTVDNSAYNAYVVFFPSETGIADYEANFRPYEVEYFLRVNKRDVTSTFEIEGLTQTFDNSKKTVTVTVPDPVNDSATLPVVINYLTDCRYAGVHQVEISLDASVENYTGYIVADLVIEKAPLTITDTLVEKVYDATFFTYVPTYTVDVPGFQNGISYDFKIEYRNYLDTTTLSTKPSEVGMYYAYVTLEDDNFEEEAVVTMQILPNYDGYIGLEQTYLPSTADESIVPVAPKFNDILVNGSYRPHSVNYTVLYKKSGESDDYYTSVLPINAGNYVAKLAFSENGYYKAYLLDMKIAKRVITIADKDNYYVSYTGEEIVLGSSSNAFNVLSPVPGAGMNYTFRSLASGDIFVWESGDDDGARKELPVLAGDYEVTATLVDENYEGEKTVVLTVTKAELEITNLPTLAGTVEFNSQSEDVTFTANTGRVIFPYTGAEMQTLGHFEVATDISNYRSGVHNVEIRFVPDDSDNYASPTATMNIQIATRNVAEYISFRDEFTVDGDGNIHVTYEFVDEQIILTPYIIEEANLIEGYTDIAFQILYNGVAKAPKSAGEYSVSVKVSDANYSGVITNVILEIIAATPVIELPEISDIMLGDTLDNSYIKTGTGGAYIASNGYSIPGTFTILSSYTSSPMDKANQRKIEIMFTPSNRSDVAQMIVEAYVNVIGTDIEVTDDDIVVSSVDGQSQVFYGAPLSSYSIALSDEFLAKAPENANATVRWADPDRILRVGESAEYIFTPADTDTYNIRTLSTAKAVITKANMHYVEGNCSVVLYEGSALKDAIIELDLYNASYPEIKLQGYTYELSVNNVGGGDFTLDYVATKDDIGKYLDGVTVTVKVYHSDYNDEMNNEFTFKVYVVRLITEFKVENLSKYYDGEAVDIADLGVTLVGTDYQPSLSEIQFKSILLNGSAVSEIRGAGVYSVTIMINEDSYLDGDSTLMGSHSGEYSFTYTVFKRDISDSISVSGNELTYADASVKLSASFEGYDIESKDIVYTYYSENGATSYGSLPPTDAGNYKVVVSIAKSNPYYTATGEFDYKISKLTATVTFDALYTYSYDPSKKISIVPEVSNNAGDYVTLMYYPLGSTNGNPDAPVNVGTYRVVATIVGHPNITGRGESSLIITQATSEIRALPSVDSITYGTPLKNDAVMGGVGINGGTVEATNGTVISGYFFYATDNSEKIPVGDNTISLIFKPNDANYATATCQVNLKVTQATIGIEISTLGKYYTGSPLYPDVTTDASIKIKYTFKQGIINVTDAVDAGIYTVTAEVVDANYKGSATATFTIYKAKALLDESTLPTGSDVTYGTVLGSSIISGGSMVYVSGQNGIYGSFKYVLEDTLLGSVKIDNATGEIAPYDVEVVFTPEDGANYELTYFTIPVKVIKARAIINIEGKTNQFTYGQLIVSPTFKTDPAGLTVDNSKFENAIGGTVQRAGTYEYVASINENNYEGEITYAVTVGKKAITVDFKNDGESADSYHSVYGIAYYPKVEIVQDTLVGADASNYLEYGKKIIFRYTNNATGESALVPPTAVGEYTVTAVLEDHDYLIDSNYASVPYIVNKATVEAINFDPDSLSNQVYGQVSVPIVNTVPAGVGYVIEFPGYESMPTKAGTHSIKVTIQDPNYNATSLNAMFRINPKNISVENLKVYNKAYDGLSNVEVKGELKGIMNGDEVDVTLTAHTRDNKVNIGVHQVVITSWKLSGMHKDNYSLRDPIYNLSVTISNKVITDPNTSSYISSAEGFSSNVTVSFQEVYDTVDQSTWFTRLLGQKATVQVISVKENGLNTVLDSKVKFYVRIPDEYLDAENLTIEGIGNLEGIIVTREGDYATFYADTSGEIVFYKTDFPYWIIPVAAAILMVVLGAVFALIALPIRRRKRIPLDARSAYEWNQGLEGREHAYKKKVEQQIVEKKRRWRY